MRGYKFTQTEREELEKNLNILNVLNSNVLYTVTFKQQAICDHEIKGKSAKLIFAEARVPEWLNKENYAKKNLSRWQL